MDDWNQRRSEKWRGLLERDDDFFTSLDHSPSRFDYSDGETDEIEENKDLFEEESVRKDSLMSAYDKPLSPRSDNTGMVK